MDFAQSLDRAARLVEAHLGTMVDRNIVGTEAINHPPPRLAEAARLAVLGGGKRLRPFLVLESAGLFGVAPEAAVPCAAALECVHCYSLVHDDLPAMDNDEIRRGRPTVWKTYGEWTAILAGNALLTAAFETLADPATHPDPEVRLALVTELAAASGSRGMVGGQAYDLAAEKLAEPRHPDLAHVARLQAMKTGALITYAAAAGGLLGKADRKALAALRNYGAELGLAFQIADDLLDAEGDAETVGKAVAKDAAAGKATVVSLIGTADARTLLAETEQRAIAALEPFGEKAGSLRAAARFMSARKA